MTKQRHELTLREKIGQTIVTRPNPDRELREHGSMSAYLRQYPVGGMFVGAEVIGEATDGPGAVREAIAAYSSASAVPLLFASDFECGCGNMIRGLTKLPYMMALGATRSERLAYDYGKATALEARSVGVRWTFAPVADLNLNPRNPIVNVRSLSDDSELAVPLLRNVVRGMQDHELIACAKHFPGDGVDERDQHLFASSNTLSRSEWHRTYGRAFRSLIDDGIGTIMTGHISLPACQGTHERINGRYLPATLSHDLTTKLLKEELGFKGVVLSDALNMGGFAGWYDRRQAEIECFKAGTDILLWPSPTYIDDMESAIDSGEVPLERLEDALDRIWELKRRFGLFERSVSDPQLSAEEQALVHKVARDVAEGSVTLLGMNKERIPLDPENVRRILVVSAASHAAHAEDMRGFADSLRRHGVHVDFQENMMPEEWEDKEHAYDLFVFAFCVRPHKPIGPLDFFGAEAMTLWSSLSVARDKTVIVSFGTPYLYDHYFAHAPVYINAYANVPATVDAVANVMFGRLEAKGRSPVKLSAEA